jgi:hypothetical protein
MHESLSRRGVRLLGSALCVLALALAGCQTRMNALSQKLTHWKMLDEKALDDPVQAVGGDALFFVPGQDRPAMTRPQLVQATPDMLVSYYSPIFVQQKVDTKAQKFPYPAEYDMIGEARLKRDKDGKLTSYVTGAPKVYAIVNEVLIEGHKHLQLTYTAWYPAHPRTRAFDVEEADIDSCVVRITLDAEHAPLFYETIAACGCFHKVFVQKWIEDRAQQHFGPPEKDKKFCVERNVKDAIHWEVAGVVQELRDEPRRPVVFLKAGDHRVIGMGSAGRLRIPLPAVQHRYEMLSYAELYEVAVDGANERAGFFDMQNGGKVRGGERRKEKFLMTFLGVDDAGRPRADNQIKLHFDQDDWKNPAIYSKYLRLPPGVL